VSSPVYVSSVADLYDGYEEFTVVDLIDHTEVTDANVPAVAARQLDAAWWARIRGESRDCFCARRRMETE
jgi:hypothetical protein